MEAMDNSIDYLREGEEYQMSQKSGNEIQAREDFLDVRTGASMMSKTGGKTGGRKPARSGKKLSQYMKNKPSRRTVEHTCVIRLLDRATPTSRAERVGNKGDMSKMSQRQTPATALSTAKRNRSKNSEKVNAVVNKPSKKDVNFYRKVSKYDIDRNRVDWKKYNKEKEY